MYKLMKKYILAAAAAVVLASCTVKPQYTQPAITYVKDILADTKSEAYGIVSRTASPRSGDAIYVIGAPAECEKMAGVMLASDVFDNVNGHEGHDILPDFAGETIIQLQDMANSPYDDFIEAGNYQYLREIAVRNLISALDSVYCISPYDVEVSGVKTPAKLVVMASAANAAYGCSDIDTLLSSVGSGIRVVYPVREMFARVLPKDAKGLSIGVISDGDNSVSGAYSAIFQQMSRAAQVSSSTCVSFPASPTDSTDALTSFLDDYLAAGYTSPLDAILIDDPAVDVVAVQEKLDSINSKMTVDSMNYGWIVREGCIVLDAASTASATCYKILRSENLFSHRIAYPRGEVYMTHLKPDAPVLTHEYLREAGSSDQAYLVVPYNERFLTVTK